MIRARWAAAIAGLAILAAPARHLVIGDATARSLARAGPAHAALATLTGVGVPTGNLDSAAGSEVLALLTRLNANGTTVMIVTHSPEIARSAPRTTRLRDGVVEQDTAARRASRRRVTGPAEYLGMRQPALWPGTRQGPPLHGTDSLRAASSNFPSNFVLGTGSTDFVEGLVRATGRGCGR